jgi:hypothetical protein
MTVRELMDVLSTLNPDTPVMIDHGGDLEEITEVGMDEAVARTNEHCVWSYDVLAIS